MNIASVLKPIFTLNNTIEMNLRNILKENKQWY